jgi:hypothetical protein
MKDLIGVIKMEPKLYKVNSNRKFSSGFQIGLLKLIKMGRMAGNIQLISVVNLRKEENFTILLEEGNGLDFLYDIYIYFYFP